MAKKGENRGPVSLTCTECGNVIRPTEKNKKNTVEKLTISKHCPKCRKHTEHKEKKN
jgi:large subunit ribosomal protein L33